MCFCRQSQSHVFFHIGMQSLYKFSPERAGDDHRSYTIPFVVTLLLLFSLRFGSISTASSLLSETKDVLVRPSCFGEKDIKMTLRSLSFKRSDSSNKMASDVSNCKAMAKSSSFKGWKQELITNKHDAIFSFKNQLSNESKAGLPVPLKRSMRTAVPDLKLSRCLLELSSPRPSNELDAAATKLQKVYKSYRTRRSLADCAVVVEELWWKALDFASLEHSSVSFFKVEKPETAASRWARARTRAAKVGKGLSKDVKAQKLALRHWLEAIDPRHRYGHNLQFYYDVWFASESTQPFFYWLDVGDGRETNLEKCPRIKLQNQCIEYLGPKEREAYEVIVKNGKLVYEQSQMPVSTTEGSKWIFVLSTSRVLYVGQKKKGKFQHSSFLAGAATTAAGRLVAAEGVLKAIWPYSGHYHPTEENFKEFIIFLQFNNVDLSNVKRCSIDDDDEYPSFKERKNETEVIAKKTEVVAVASTTAQPQVTEAVEVSQDGGATEKRVEKRLQKKWITATGARIGCVRDYPAELQSMALEKVNLSPRTLTASASPRDYRVPVPVPSPRPSPKVRLSPRLQYMGIPSPTVSLALPPSHRRR